MKIAEASKRLSVIFKDRLHIIHACKLTDNSHKESSKISVLCDQILDSIIVGGITGISAYIAAGESASFKAAVLAFALTFLIKMKEYRKIK